MQAGDESVFVNAGRLLDREDKEVNEGLIVGAHIDHMMMIFDLMIIFLAQY